MLLWLLVGEFAVCLVLFMFVVVLAVVLFACCGRRLVVGLMWLRGDLVGLSSLFWCRCCFGWVSF